MRQFQPASGSTLPPAAGYGQMGMTAPQYPFTPPPRQESYVENILGSIWEK